MTTSLIIDIVTICLLTATIVYAVMLNRRIQMIHQNKDELKDMLGGFSAALERAEISVFKLKTSSHDAVSSLKGNLDEARSIRDDLQVLVERGERIANTLEENIRESRTIPIKDFAQHLNSASQQEAVDNIDSDSDYGDDQILSEVKQKLIGRLKTLK